METRFLAWLRRAGIAREPPIQNLVWNFYETEKKAGQYLYPLLSAKAILWLVQRGLVGEATEIAESLLHWQQASREGQRAKSYGAFPSLIELKESRWVSGERFYSGDNLCILAALLALHAKTNRPEFLSAGVRIGRWLMEVMCNGVAHQMWVEDHAAPMQFVTIDGDFSNHIKADLEMLWLDALIRLAEVTKEDAYRAQAERAIKFLLGAQYANGAILDHYDPGYPARPYDGAHWKPYQANQVISDNVLRTAVGLCKYGELERARRFYEWLKVDDGGVSGYVNLETGGHGFPPDQRVYFDVTSSGLHRTLCQWLGERAQARVDMAFLAKTQDESGCWPWGIFREGLQPVEPKLAPVAGFWATADLSTRIG